MKKQQQPLMWGGGGGGGGGGGVVIIENVMVWADHVDAPGPERDTIYWDPIRHFVAE